MMSSESLKHKKNIRVKYDLRLCFSVLLCFSIFLTYFSFWSVYYRIIKRPYSYHHVVNTVNIIEQHRSDPTYVNYHMKPKTMKSGQIKVIFLWTPIQKRYRNWAWGIGPQPVIKDCENPKIDKKCILTNHEDMLEHADVILFSIQDMKKVGKNAFLPPNK